MSAITLAESKRLVELEGVIRRGKQAFIEAGNALMEIRDKELWRYDYKSFEDYCHKVWGWKKSYSYMLMESAVVVKALPKSVSTIVENPGQVSALAKVPKEKRAEVLEKAASNGKVTARSIAEAAKPPPEVRQTPVVDIPAEVAFVEGEEERLNTQGNPANEIIQGIEAVLKDLKEPNPYEPPKYGDLANELIACARNLRVLEAEAAA